MTTPELVTFIQTELVLFYGAGKCELINFDDTEKTRYIFQVRFTDGLICGFAPYKTTPAFEIINRIHFDIAMKREYESRGGVRLGKANKELGRGK